MPRPAAWSFDRRTSARLAEAGPVAGSSLRNVEGVTANAYFAGLPGVFPEGVGFRGRNCRPPSDPVNACLSLGYTLVHTDAVPKAPIVDLGPTMDVLHDLESWARIEAPVAASQRLRSVAVCRAVGEALAWSTRLVHNGG